MQPLKVVLERYRSAYVNVAVISAILNILTLAGSIYMMLVYDTVLPSQSLTTLAGLLAMLALAYLFQGAFEILRGRILGDVASAFDQTLARRVQQAIGNAALTGMRRSADGLEPMRDLDAVRNYLSGPGPAVLMDLPWTLLFLGFLTLLHPWLGLVTFLGGLLLVALTIVADRRARAPSARLAQATAERAAISESHLRHVETLQAMGMRDRLLDRWQGANQAYHHASRTLAADTATLSSVSKLGRMFLQSLILTVGAILVIEGKASGGVIFASSILSGRALAPIDYAIATWRPFVGARQAWYRLTAFLGELPEPVAPAITLPKPSADLWIQQLHVSPPGTRTLSIHNISLALCAGDGLGIVGPSGAGKSTLCRAILGLWKPALGEIRLDGATLDQYDGQELGRAIGYLPQTVELMEGTVAQNIARFDPQATSETVIAAARAAGVHDLILGLPDGYETQLGQDGGRLSLGQQQRVALARALYGDPFLVLLDEPNSNLDHDGDRALEGAIRGVRARGGIVILISHRPSLLNSVNLALFLRNGRMQAFGNCEDVLPQLMAPRPAPAAQAPDHAPAPAAPTIVRQVANQ